MNTFGDHLKRGTRLLVLSCIVFAPIRGWPQPIITRHPTNLYVSVGANPVFRAAVTSADSPASFQWLFNGQPLADRTNVSLTVTNVRIADAGDYSVLIRNDSGSVTSRIGRLDVDATFTKITSGPIASLGGYSFSASWGDYDDDGYIDLFVSNDLGSANPNGNDFLFRNNRDGTFARVTSGPLVNDGVWSIGGAWGDYDNDGNLDIYVCKPERLNTLYRGDGSGGFVRVSTGPIATESNYSHAGVWADSNRDGWLDMFVANFGPSDPAMENVLYQSDGRGGFTRIGFGRKARGADDSWNALWADFDNDGWPDLFVPQGGVERRNPDRLYLNDRSGGLRPQTNSVFAAEADFGVGAAAGDFDNDGDLDLFVTRFYGERNGLYRNDGLGAFVRVTDSIVETAAGCSVGCAWGDYDNDGWLDLFVANLGPVDFATYAHRSEENNFLYHNNGDGTFTPTVRGSPANDLGYSTGCGWGDYDNDGFLDLAVANGWITGNQSEFLYRNNGNTNSWIGIRAVGTVSNRSAIGAKVRVRSKILGRTIWQMREVSGGSNYGSQNDLRAHFGLRDAEKVEVVRIEWPSGATSELHDVIARQYLTLVEPPRLSIAAKPSEPTKLKLWGGVGFTYRVEVSADLRDWFPLGTNTAIGPTLEFLDTDASGRPRGFYRARRSLW